MQTTLQDYAQRLAKIQDQFAVLTRKRLELARNCCWS
jgi:hypothetical protein